MPSLSSCLLLLSLLLPFVTSFTHPGLAVNKADIARIKTKLAARKNPWQASWDKLLSLKYSQATYVNQAVSRVHRGQYDGAASNAKLLWHDVAAAFNLGLRWKIEGNESYAEAASNILGAWGRTLKNLDDTDDQYLFAGLQGSELVNAAELIRDYPSFESSGNAKAFRAMFQDVFLSKNIFFLNHQAPSEHNVKHFHANWELCNMASVLAFGIYTDNTTLFDYAIDYFKNGDGNGGINNAFTNLVKEPGTGTIMAQPQEAGRDQGHTALDFQLHGVIAQQAWNQGVDLYGYNNSRILQGAEYFARYNLGNDVPFEPWTNNIQTFTTISNASRGATRPTWELLYAHYIQVKGLKAPWTTLYRNHTIYKTGYETGIGAGGDTSGQYDGLGWGSLLHRLDEDDVQEAQSAASTAVPVASSTAAPVQSTLVAVSRTTSHVSSSTPSVSYTSSKPNSSKEASTRTVAVTPITPSQSANATPEPHPPVTSIHRKPNACARRSRHRI
ncbi:chondroitin AC/alginate lyase [Paraphoma chrysanthemicola]|uniref:Chondroitin AC/alginate lyase n=1 Tax=Paraphoma chrysanthemicola TaxID=798071 RepID=A0A8K0QZL3_9PLEO|nr:chondroitin AC/alginate lyase [Paraphoma chrysanthemicola]